MALKSFQVKPQTKELNLIATSSCILNTRQDQTCNDGDFTSRNDGSNPPELVVMCFHRRCCCYPAASSLAGVPGERGGGHPPALPPCHHGAQRLPHPAHHQGARGPNQVPRERRRRCRSETKQTGEVQLQLWQHHNTVTLWMYLKLLLWSSWLIIIMIDSSVAVSLC